MLKLPFCRHSPPCRGDSSRGGGGGGARARGRARARARARGFCQLLLTETERRCQQSSSSIEDG